MTQQELISAISETVDSAIDRFNAKIPSTQRQMMREINVLLRDLDYDGDKIKVTVKNMKAIGDIRNKLRRIIFKADYIDNVKDYMKTFNEIASLQNQYMGKVNSDFKITPVLKELKQQAINSTIDSLTKVGIEANVIKPIQEILRINITTGGSYKEMTDQLRIAVEDTISSEGTLNRYVKGTTTDAISVYSRQYLQQATDALGMDWFLYTGSLKTTSRCFCIAMRERKYFHRAEIPALIKGEFPEFEQHECKIYAKTGLPDGFFPNTTADNFLTNGGGFNCTHRSIPVIEVAVPKRIKDEFYNNYPSYRPRAAQS